MKVICPKCQYENQAETSRIVCARCATIIDVRLDQGTGLDSNGKRHTARLPFASNPSNSQPSNSQPLNSQSLGQPHDVYATRIGEEFDDVLDIPRPTAQGYQTTYESSPAFDDVFATPGYESTASYDYPGGERKPTTPIDTFEAGMHRRQTQDYLASPEPEFMGWPVLPESSVDEEEPASGFTTSKGGLLSRVLLGALVFGGLVFGAYYFLGDLINKRKPQPDPAVVEKNNQDNVAAVTSPETKPSVEAPKSEKSPDVTINPKPPATDQKNPGTILPIPDNPEKIVGKDGRTPAPKPPSVPSTPNKGNLTIQVAAFKDQAQANDRVDRLRAASVDARVVRADLPIGTWYRVQIGGFATRDEAQNYGNQLKSKNILQEFMVTSKGK